jgi:hypothetical protein
MGLPADTLELIQATARQAVAPFEVHRDDRQAIFLIDGAPTVVELPEEPREHTAGCLAEIIALANRFKEAGSSPVVWYDFGRIVLVIDDDAHRIATATFAPVVSDVFARAVQLRAKKEWMLDKDFIRLLRLDLARTLEPAILLDHVRSLKWSSTAEQAAVNTRMKGLCTKKREKQGFFVQLATLHIYSVDAPRRIKNSIVRYPYEIPVVMASDSPPKVAAGIIILASGVVYLVMSFIFLAHWMSGNVEIRWKTHAISAEK